MDQDRTITIIRRSLTAVILLLVATLILVAVTGGHLVGPEAVHALLLMGGTIGIVAAVLVVSFWIGSHIGDADDRRYAARIARDTRERREKAEESPVAQPAEPRASAPGPRRLPGPDPIKLAQLAAPDLEDAVAKAMRSITRLRGMERSVHDQSTADALALTNGSLVTTLRHYEHAAVHADDDERAAMARRTLGAVIDVGRVAETARHEAVERMNAQINEDARYIASRAGDEHLLPLPDVGPKPRD